MDEKQKALEALQKRCFAARVPIYKVCDKAHVARSTPSRWARNPGMMQASTLAKLEAALDEIEAGQ